MFVLYETCTAGASSYQLNQCRCSAINQLMKAVA